MFTEERQDAAPRVLGLRLVKKSVNQDDPGVYHVFFSDEHGRPGADITFFEYPGAARGRVGPGSAYRVVWRVGSPDTMASWGEAMGEARSHAEAWWLIAFPGLALLSTLIACTLLGEAARDALDPKLRSEVV